MKSNRIRALDAFRGLVMFGMVIADNQPFGYPFLEHSKWDGITPVDLIFPSFLFIIGMAVPLSLKSVSARPLIRALLLALIGVLLNLQAQNFDFTQVRLPGVLQRAAICYAACALVHWGSDFGKRLEVQAGAVVLSFCVYLSFMVGESYNRNCKTLTQQCNYGRDLDLLIFGPNHMMKPTDPEGLLSNASAFVTTVAGYCTTILLLRLKHNYSDLLKEYAKLTVFFLVMAAFLTYLQPLNKRLWSTSFALLSSGLAVFSFSVSLVVFDCLKVDPIQRIADVISQPLIWLGSNPLAIYVLMNLVEGLVQSNISWGGRSLEDRYFQSIFVGVFGDKQLASMIYGLILAILYTAVACLLYRKSIFLRL